MGCVLRPVNVPQPWPHLKDLEKWPCNMLGQCYIIKEKTHNAKGTVMQDPEFGSEVGEHEFTLDDRRKVKDVIDRVLDEMGDNFTLNRMFTPYANIVHKMLTDPDIKQQIDDEAADYATELEGEE